MLKGVSNGGGLKTPANLAGGWVVWELIRVLVEPSEIEYPIHYLIKEAATVRANDPVWGVVTINDMVEYRQFDMHFNEREYYYDVMTKQEYDTYVTFFQALPVWPARCFFKRKKDENHSEKS
jgi:hypothetical protein